MSEEQMFDEVLQATQEQRAVLLDQLCAGQPELRARLEKLLAAHAAPDGLLEHHPADPQATGDYVPASKSKADAIAEGPGSRIGPYKLLQKIGEGGMGAVFLAEQEKPVQRRVALKIIKAGMDSKAVLARFEAERQALAMMDHPNIAKVLDAGTTDVGGRPYFVMELVKGIPITKYCDQEHLTPKERLDLFIPVCQAVQHAHQKGIIHRDIKPSNVIVALYDGRPVPKVIDFGVAKATQQKLTEKTMFTEVGQIVGTLEYMAPEQAELNNLDIDTRADIYSLGVLLYELLTGSPPFTSQQLRSAGFVEMLRMIREVEPAKPSTRLSSSAELPSIAARRKLEPKRLTRLIKGDLDWIIMKALEKDRGRRYDTANALAGDIQRYLNLEPVLAGPPSVSYRVRKFVRRHRAMVIAATVFLLALIGGIIGTSLGFWHADQARRDEAEQRKVAVQERDRAERERDEKEKARKSESEQRLAAEANRKAAEAAQLQAERHLLAGIIRPMGFNTREYDPAELAALEQLAALPEARLKLRFLEEAVGDPEVAIRFLRRVPEATQAAIGASPQRRQAALALASAVQRDAQADIRCKTAACWLTLELGGTDLPALLDAIKDLLQRNLLDEVKLAECIPAIPQQHLPPLTDTLLDRLGYVRGSAARRALAKALTACVARLDAATAQAQLTRATDSLLDRLCKETDNDARYRLAKALVECVARLDAATAQPQLTQVADTLLDRLGKETDGNARNAFAEAMAACVARLDDATVQPYLTKTIDTLLDRLGKETDGDAWYGLAEALGMCVARLNAAAAQPQLTRAVDTLLGRLGKETDGVARRALAKPLTACVARLDAATAQPKLTRAIDTLLDRLGKETDGDARYGLAKALGMCVARLNAAAAQPQLTRAIDTLLDRLGKETDGVALHALAEALVVCVPLLDTAAAQPQLTRAIDTLLDRLGKYRATTFWDARSDLAEALGMCVAKLDATKSQPQLTKWIDTLLDRLGKETDEDARYALAEALAICVPLLDTATAQPRLTKWTDALLDRLGKETDGVTRNAIAEALGMCVARLNAATAQPYLTKTIDALLDRLGKKKDGDAWYGLAEALAVCVAKLDAATAQPRLTRAIDMLLDRLGQETDWDARDGLAKALGICVARLDFATAQPQLTKWTATLLNRLGEETYRDPYHALVQVLAACVARLDTTKAAVAASQATNLLLQQASREGMFDSSALPLLLKFIHDRRQLATFLRSPACVHDIRSVILFRLEELCFPIPGDALLPSAAVGSLDLFPGSLGMASMVHHAGMTAQRYHTRRFRTIWDAVEWFEKHEPGIDWDSPWKP